MENKISNFTIKDLGIAYRKAKVDLYYSTQTPLLAISEYEDDLISNLKSLLTRLNSEDASWSLQDSFLGDWTLVPKSINSANPNNGLIFSSPEDKWENCCKEKEKPKAEFRLMANVSLDFHVISALWIQKVGQKYDSALKNCSYGNRLRRAENGKYNDFSLGSFKPYLKPFRDWRDSGIKAMQTALEEKKKIIALTADVTSFYHELNADFMLEKSFNSIFELKLSDDEKKLHKLFINALKAWSNKTPLQKGLPVGLPASAVIANLALIELDKIIEEQIAPIYYGRYVDDIILVIENGANFQSTEDLWQWIFDKSDKKLAWAGKDKITFKPKYLSNSKIFFENSKNKIFILEGETGKTLINSIACQIRERASEWRAMPYLPNSAEHISTDLVAATQSDGEAADNLRKADALTMRRAGFAIKLRDFEAYQRDLDPDDWRDHRHAFFHAFIEHVLVLPNFFDLALYLPRVLKLATSCEDFKHLKKLLDRLDIICKSVKNNCVLNIKSDSKKSRPTTNTILQRWTDQLGSTVLESITASFPPSLSKKGKTSWKIYMSKYSPPFSQSAALHWPKTEKAFQLAQVKLFNYDLAYMPFRFIGFPKEMISRNGIPSKKTVIYFKKPTSILPLKVTNGIATLASQIELENGFPNGLLFATRPFNLAELFAIIKSPFSPEIHESLKSIVLSIRGFSVSKKMPLINKNNLLIIPDGKPREKQTIAVSSWKTENSSWIASITQTSTTNFERYGRLARLTTQLISQSKNVAYFVLPELALPARWFIRFSQKLQSRKISFITGIEYLHKKNNVVCNQVWAALTHDGLGFPSMMIYRQDKQFPALHEEQELKRLADCKLKPIKSWKKPIIIQHGDFRFGLLICSELTNIRYRATLRGKIDALFVPEWNRDTETFNALVESAALDIHTYIIQCNDRQYGDSRIRAPYKDNWRRDILRVKGGTTDYYVIGEIDIHALRQFQSSHRSPNGPFKPVPDGFKINPYRKVLPLSQ